MLGFILVAVASKGLRLHYNDVNNSMLTSVLQKVIELMVGG